MKTSVIEKFNELYSGSEMYYGWDLRKEFTDCLGKMELAGKTALDLGCGEGRYAVYLAERGCKVIAIDLASAGIQKVKRFAEERELEIEAFVQAVDQYVFPPDHFDIIVAMTILDHLEHDARKEVIAGIQKSLKKGGILFAYVLTVSDPGYKRKMEKIQEEEESNGVSETSFAIEYYFRSYELAKQFPGLEILHYNEGMEPDFSHGKPHRHGFASLIARKS
ncbi:MAG: class I SAM-dependent methyltransferase [Calditrichia bacterium]